MVAQETSQVAGADTFCKFRVQSTGRVGTESPVPRLSDTVPIAEGCISGIVCFRHTVDGSDP